MTSSLPVKFVTCAVIMAALFVGPCVRAGLAATVTVPGDYSTIQAAINAVPSGSTINVQAGTYPERLWVSNTSRSLTVRALGVVIVDAAGKGDAALTVSNATGQVVFQGLTFRNGARSAGGGFFIQNSSPSFFDCIFENSTAHDGAGGALFNSSATFIDCIIRNNSAAHFGGGVYIVAGSRPVFTNCDIVANHSGTGGQGVGNNGAGGGVLSVESSPTFRGSRINGNTSKFASGGIHHQGVFGSPYGQSMLVVEDTDVADNVSTQFGPSDNPAEGGGIHVEDNATATLTRARILRNSAGTGGGLNAYRGRFDIVDSVIDANTSRQTATGGFGGGIAATSNFASASMPGSVINLTRTLVRNNVALAADGGATGIAGGIAVFGDTASSIKASLVLSSSVVDNNRSASQGGGILVNHADLTVTNSLIIRNIVTGGPLPFGGGILVTTNATATISGSTIAHNTAAGSNGLGGGIFFNDTTAINVNGSNVYANTAGNRGGGVFIGTSTQSGTVSNSIIADNVSTTWAGQINEDACSSVTYQNNTITPLSGNTLFSGCAPGGRATNTNSSAPRFAHFLAVPTTGTSLTLAWSVARATSVTIAGVATWNSPSNSPTGTVDRTPGSSTTYTLTAAATPAYGPVTANFTVVQPAPPPPPPTTGHIIEGDFDGDAKAGITVFRPSNGTWYIRYTSTGGTAGFQFGNGNDKPVPGDYDGDGKIDIAVFRPSNGTWYLRYSGTGATAGFQWGNGADKPVPGDYDGDGKTNLAVFRPSNGTWYLVYSSTGATGGLQWGNSSDVLTPADYDGDGKTDIAVFRPSDGTWYIRYSTTGSTGAFQWGNGSDVPVPADYNGDGKEDIAVFRPSNGTWYLLYSGTGTTAGFQFGNGLDVPVPGDFDGDGKTDIAVFRPSNGTWYLWYSQTGTTAGFQWGNTSDYPVLKNP